MQETININSNKHPKALWYIMAIYMWEYVSFYWMRALLILYLTQELLLSDSKSYAIYGSFVTLVYLIPIFGGVLADKLLGFKQTVIIGALLMSCRHLITGINGSKLLYLGMAFIICGYGYFKTNVPCLVGDFGRILKFMFGFILQLLCFVMLILSAGQLAIYGEAHILWVLFAIFALGLSELFIDPIALS